jgi:hypothetical protein
MTTIRELIDGLIEGASVLEEGLDAAFSVAVCNGDDLQFINRVDIGHWTRPADDGSLQERFMLLRAHLHPGEEAGELSRGVAADADQVLREWTGEPGSEPSGG